jgi:hypothetical protein
VWGHQTKNKKGELPAAAAADILGTENGMETGNFCNFLFLMKL